ncbi:ParB/RepB/Spo0J family partition protein [Salmonella enterica]|nr:ParB/RepB/Spo0J family partition protein [Salmonella enterica subsp. diarizonae]EEP9805460.1 ParB/RepB/Spo0J family partition protein [Salmonella enterica subsp. diarizonae]EGV3634193.1 ParB/RepB/Spo0J family partition protein [Salmonella enterica]EKL0442091.1 ParB/RepB/Spo0J family partition protein [Salmonella enterica]HCM1887521.1 ParB/RepB/Spo0J family partition protein [Salmonella enterica subsp. diarizonae serovar 57:c:z]
MMKEYEEIKLVDISKIKIVNSRSRSKSIHDELVESIRNIGLKKPITVRLSDTPCEKYMYDLICGQGRIEAYQILGEKQIPAIVKSVNHEDGHIMSLAENIARRKPRATELLNSIIDLKNKGFTDSEIASKVGHSKNWVNAIVSLKEKGEDKLLAAVESGKIPISLAVEISRAKGNGIQEILLEGFNTGELNSKQIAIIKKIMIQRETSGKGSDNNAFVQGVKKKRITTEELRVLYQDNVKKHKMIHTRSEFTISSLMVVKEIMTNLLKNEAFIDVLSSEGLNSVPVFILDNVKPNRGMENE